MLHYVFRTKCTSTITLLAVNGLEPAQDLAEGCFAAIQPKATMTQDIVNSRLKWKLLIDAAMHKMKQETSFLYSS